MNEYTPGQRVTIVDLISDPFTKALAGQPSDPATGNLLIDDTTEAITIWRPNGVALTPAPTAARVSTGTYHFTFLVPAATTYPDSSVYGVWSWQSSSTGSALGNSTIGQFLVVPTPS